MNNQNSGQYGYVNLNGRLVPTSSLVNRTNTERNGQKPKTAQSTTGAKVVYNTPQQQSQQRQPRQGVIYNTPGEVKTNSGQKRQQMPKQTYAERTVEKANKKTEKKAEKQKNRGKGIKKLCFTLSLLMILSAAKQMPFNVNARITELAAKNGSHNYMDDVFASDEKIEVISNGKTKKVQLEDAVNKLEDLTEICTLISKLKLDETDYPELTDKEKKAAIALYEELGIEGVIEAYKESSVNSIEKARAARQLLYIREYVGGDWLDDNGLNIAIALLEKTIKTAAIEHYGTFDALEYGVVDIPEANQYPFFTVGITDPVSGAKDSVTFTPIAAGEYAQAILTLRDLKDTDASKLTQQEKLNKIRHALRIVRKCLGKEVEDVLGITYTKQVK